MLCACIDIGSNTTRLLVGECVAGGLREIASERSFTRLGEGLARRGAIPAGKIAEVAEIVSRQGARARALGAGRVRVVGTAAVRQAANATQLGVALRRAAGLELEVLTAEDEARLAFRGATWSLVPDPGGPVGVVDVGGGSSELVVGTLRRGAARSVSLEIGSGSLADRCFSGDPPAPEELAHARALVAEAFAGVAVARPARALAVGGSATSLWRVVGPVLAPAGLAAAVLALTAAPCSEVAERFGLDEQRVRLLPAGILVLEAASLAFGRPLEVADGGLREGVLLDEAERG